MLRQEGTDGLVVPPYEHEENNSVRNLPPVPSEGGKAVKFSQREPVYPPQSPRKRGETDRLPPLAGD